MRLALGETIVLELLHQLEQLHADNVVRHPPQRPLWRIGHNARCLGINELVVIGQSRGGHPVLVLTFVDLLYGRTHHAVVAGNHGILQAEIDVSLLIQRSLEKAMCPGLHFLNAVGREHPWVALSQGPPMYFDRVAAAAYKHHLGNAGGIG